ncbi:MAG: hypothetical protein U1F36_12000 [Planctomycetota bacterium]
MNQLALAFDDDRRAFEPGATIRGRALWLCEQPPTSIEVRLFWRTQGKGDTDLEVVDVARIETTDAAGEQPFAISAPRRPWSFSGKLISLIWALEIVALPSEDSERFDITIAPQGREVILFRAPG